MEMTTIDDEVDELINSEMRETSDEAMVSVIDDEIFFRRNSVNVIIGRRGSGKTFSLLREILKLLMLGHTEYTQLFYVSDKYSDDSVAKLKPLLEKYIQFNWVETKDALQLITALEYGKANMNEPEFRESLNAQSLGDSVMPNTILFFDDCISVFSKTDSLAKKLYQNRQSRITVFLGLQDVNGLNSSMKANMDSLMLFGGFSAHKFSLLTYQMPPISLTFERYARLGPKDCVIVDFASGNIVVRYRDL